MNRREMLQLASASGAVALIGGVTWVRMAFARRELSRELTRNAMEVLARTVERELEQLPAIANAEVKAWFQNACLNSAEFVEYICSDSFAEKLASCRSEQDREWVVTNAFVTKVVSEQEIMRKVRTIAERTGAELDEQWEASTKEIEEKWNVQVFTSRQTRPSKDLIKQLNPIVNRQLAAVLSQAESASHRPSSTEVAFDTLKLGGSVLMLLRVAPKLAIPLFVAVALLGLGKYVWGKLTARAANYRRAISDRIAQLGTQVGAELESELRARISDLHSWQQQALAETADAYARERIGPLS